MLIFLVVSFAALHPFQRQTLAARPTAVTRAAQEVAAARAPAPATFGPKAPDCDSIRFGGGSSRSTHRHSDDDNAGSSIIDYTQYNGEKCSSVTIIGRLTYSAAEDDARRWFANYLPAVLMEAGINVGPRIARWRTRGGVDYVLTRIATMSSSGAKRWHYEALMDAERLSNGDLDKIVRHAGRNLSSSGDLRAVLEKAAPTRGGGIRSGSALEEAIVSGGAAVREDVRA